MPPSDVSLKRSRKVPDTVFFSSLRSWLRLTKPMMRLEQRKQLRDLPAPLIPWMGRECQVLALALLLINCTIVAKSLRFTDDIHLAGSEEV